MTPRDLVSETFADVYDAFDWARGATVLGWHVVFVGWCEKYRTWLVWVEYPGSITADKARDRIASASATEASTDSGRTGRAPSRGRVTPAARPR